MPVQVVIFTDMDGSLLDHDSYSHAEADDCLHWLRNKHIPVIPCTSKTRAEMEVLRDDLNNKHPFVIENGAALFVPKDTFSDNKDFTNEDEQFYVKSFTHPRAHWQTILDNTPMHLNDAFLTFKQAGTDGIMEMTGLTTEEARRASQREFGEPLKWLGSEHDFKVFEEYINSHGGSLLTGGRFIHLSGHCNKGRALRWLVDKYQQEETHKVVTSVALGDSQNDVAMLSEADYAVMIRSPVHDFPIIDSKIKQNVYQTKDMGSKGWVEGIKHVLHQLDLL